jgi:hypothetical protein
MIHLSNKFLVSLQDTTAEQGRRGQITEAVDLKPDLLLTRCMVYVYFSFFGPQFIFTVIPTNLVKLITPKDHLPKHSLLQMYGFFICLLPHFVSLDKEQ